MDGSVGVLHIYQLISITGFPLRIGGLYFPLPIPHKGRFPKSVRQSCKPHGAHRLSTPNLWRGSQGLLSFAELQ
jgi:hypothetical protein